MLLKPTDYVVTTRNIFRAISTPARLRTVEQTMGLLAGTKGFVDKFFDNVKVNDENEQIKKNRLELLFLLCKTFDSFADFSKFEV